MKCFYERTDLHNYLYVYFSIIIMRLLTEYLLKPRVILIFQVNVRHSYMSVDITSTSFLFYGNVHHF